MAAMVNSHQTLTSDQAGDDATHILDIVLYGLLLVAEGFHLCCPSNSLSIRSALVHHGTRHLHLDHVGQVSAQEDRISICQSKEAGLQENFFSGSTQKAGIVISIG
jgi:hypothetical protein